MRLLGTIWAGPWTALGLVLAYCSGGAVPLWIAPTPEPSVPREGFIRLSNVGLHVYIDGAWRTLSWD